MINSALSHKIPERIKRIDELSHNIWWSWHPKARDVFRALDYSLWRSSGHNPVKELYDIDEDNLQSAAKDPVFLAIFDSVIADFDAYMSKSDTWFSANFPGLLAGLWPIFPWNLLFMLLYRFTPEVWEFWPEICARNPATWVYRLLESDLCIPRDIFISMFQEMGGNRKYISS